MHNNTACQRILSALNDCQKKHPRQEREVCGHLHRSAAWCLFYKICPDEIDGLNACVGKQAHVVPPYVVPKQCQHYVVKLEACLVMHQGDDGGGSTT